MTPTEFNDFSFYQKFSATATLKPFHRFSIPII